MHFFGLLNSSRPHAIAGRGRPSLRRIDKLAGVPAVFLLGLRRRPRPLPRNIGRIGLLNTAAIGDTLLMSAPLADIRTSYPDAEVVLMVGPSNREVAGLLDPEVRIVCLPVSHPLKSLRIMREFEFDLLLDFGPWARLNAVLTALSRARFTVGFRTAGQYRHYAYDLAVEHSAQVHELDNHRRLTAALNIGASHRPRIDSSLLNRADAVRAKNYLVFHQWPGGSASRLKQWPAERWVNLAEHFARRGYEIVLTGSPSQKRFNDELIASLGGGLRGAVLNRAGLDLAATCGLIAGSALVVSVDTGVMHLAAALEVPMVALMGPACRRRWGPVSDRARVVESPLSGCCYLNLGFEIPRRPPKCMEAISLESVRARCEEMLERREISAASAKDQMSASAMDAS